MSDVFDQANNVNPNEQENVDYLAQMKAKDERFEDPAFLAKKAYYGDQHISKIEQENESLRKKLEESQTAGDVLAQLKAEITQSRNSQSPPSVENTTHQSEEKPDIEALVKEQVASLNRESMVEANKAKAIGDLSSSVGADNVAAVLAKKASELGVSTSYLRDVAAQSPAAFASFFPSTSGAAPRPTSQGVNTEALHNAKPSDTANLNMRKAEMRKVPMASRSKAWHEEYSGINSKLLGF